MYNKVILIGRICSQPELRYTATNNLPVASFTLAVNRPYGDKQADFISCTAWRKTAEIVHKWVNKGDLLTVDGSLQTRDYVDKNDIKRYVTEVVCDNVVLMPHTTKESEPTKEQGKQNDDSDLPFPDRKKKVEITDDVPF